MNRSSFYYLLLHLLVVVFWSCKRTNADDIEVQSKTIYPKNLMAYVDTGDLTPYYKCAVDSFLENDSLFNVIPAHKITAAHAPIVVPEISRVVYVHDKLVVLVFTKVISVKGLINPLTQTTDWTTVKDSCCYNPIVLQDSLVSFINKVKQSDYFIKCNSNSKL